MTMLAHTLEVRDVTSGDTEELVDLLNAVIAKGGTTALEKPYSAAELEHDYLKGPDVICCFVAVEPATGRIEGFQTLGHISELPRDIGDIGTFARLNGTQRGVGTALFAATRARARDLGLSAINAKIRADNTGGLAFYTRQGFVDHEVVEGAPLRDETRIERVVKRYTLTPHP